MVSSNEIKKMHLFVYHNLTCNWCTGAFETRKNNCIKHHFLVVYVDFLVINVSVADFLFVVWCCIVMPLVFCTLRFWFRRLVSYQLDYEIMYHFLSFVVILGPLA